MRVVPQIILRRFLLTACFLVAGSGVALDSPNCRFTIQEGRDDWACVSGWRTCQE